MSKRSPNLLLIISTVFVVLFVYTAVSKLVDFEEYRGQILNQPMPLWINHVLVWFIPFAELLLAGLLVYPKTQTAGITGTFFLMLLFTGYVGLVYFNFFHRVPCSCGGVFEQLGWGEHLVVNVFFLVMAGVGVAGRTKGMGQGA